MKLLILGATGMVGKSYAAEALRRGHIVTACARKFPPEILSEESYTAEQLDVLAEPERLTEFITGHDVALSALRPAAGHEDLLVDMTRLILKAAQFCKTRVYLTGGAGPLLLTEGSGETVLSAPGFLPEGVRPIAEACGRQNELLDEFDQAEWICLRPPALLIEGQRTGRNAIGRNTLISQSDGVSQISCADFAVAMLDLIELKVAPRQRLTVGW